MGIWFIRIALLIVILVMVWNFAMGKLGIDKEKVLNLFSKTKKCSNCDGKGYWLNTRNREMCDWCQGTGRLPKHVNL